MSDEHSARTPEGHKRWLEAVRQRQRIGQRAIGKLGFGWDALREAGVRTVERRRCAECNSPYHSTERHQQAVEDKELDLLYEQDMEVEEQEREAST